MLRGQHIRVCTIIAVAMVAWNATTVEAAGPRGRVAILDQPDLCDAPPGDVLATTENHDNKREVDTNSLPGTEPRVTWSMRGQPSAPGVLKQICTAAQWDVELLSARQLADSHVLTNQRFDLLIVPTGRVFPVAARRSLIAFLRGGGDLITMGEHAFEDLRREDNGHWLSERELICVRRERAMRRDQSLLIDGGFEGAAEVPIGGDVIDRRWRRTGSAAVVEQDSPAEGMQCGRVELAAADGQSSGGFYAKVPVVSGHTYHASGYVRARGLGGPGIAYISVYQLDERGALVAFRDFAAVRRDTDWQRFEYTFTASHAVTHVRLQCGLFRKNGTACFDDIRLVDLEDATFEPINTSWGEPGDGLRVAPEQIGIFDPSYPLKRAARLKTARKQRIVDAEVNLE